MELMPRFFALRPVSPIRTDWLVSSTEDELTALEHASDTSR